MGDTIKYKVNNVLQELIDILKKQQVEMDKFPLNHMQIAVVKRLALGMTISEIAGELHKSTSTIKWHVAKTREQFQAKNNTHLIYLCCVSGHIDVSGSDKNELMAMNDIIRRDN